MANAIDYAYKLATNFGSTVRKATGHCIISVNTTQGSHNPQYQWMISDTGLIRECSLDIATVTVTTDKDHNAIGLSITPMCEFMSEKDWDTLFQSAFDFYSERGPAEAVEFAKTNASGSLMIGSIARSDNWAHRRRRGLAQIQNAS